MIVSGRISSSPCARSRGSASSASLGPSYDLHSPERASKNSPVRRFPHQQRTYGSVGRSNFRHRCWRDRAEPCVVSVVLQGVLREQRVVRDPAPARRLGPAHAAGPGLSSLEEGSKEFKEHLEKNQQELQRRVEDVEDHLDAGPETMLKDVVGEYRFNDLQLEVFRYLVTVMRDCARCLFILAFMLALNVAHEVATRPGSSLPEIVQGIGLSSFAGILSSSMVGLLVWMGAVSFRKVLEAERGKMAYVMQGMMQMGVIMMQMTTIQTCMAVLQLLEAAVRWPQISVPVGIGAAVLAAARTLAMGRVLTAYAPGSGRAAMALLCLKGEGQFNQEELPWIDRAALALVGGLMLPFAIPSEASQMMPEGGEKVEETLDMDSTGDQDPMRQYELSQWENRILDVIMDSMRMSALSVALQCLSSILLGAALFRGGGIGASWGSGFDITDQFLRASLLFSAAGCFRLVTQTEGRDVEHLLHGLSNKDGLGTLFFRMKNVAWGIAQGKAIALAFPYIQKTWLWHQLAHYTSVIFGAVSSWIIRHLPSQLRGMVAAIGC